MSSRSSSPLRNVAQLRMRLTKESMENLQGKMLSEPIIGYEMKFKPITKILQGEKPLCWLIAPLGVLLSSNPDFLCKYLIKNESLELRGYAIFKNSFGYDIVKYDNSDNCTQSILVNLVKNCGLMNPGLPTTLGLLLDLPCIPMNPKDQTRSTDKLIVAFTFAQIVTFCTSKTAKKLHPNHVYSLVGYTDDKWILLEPNGTGNPILPKDTILNCCCNLDEGSFTTLDKNKDDDELSLICIMYNLEMMRKVGVTSEPSKNETYILINSNKQLYGSERPKGVELIHQFNTSSLNPALNFHSYLFKSENGFDLPNTLGRKYIFTNLSQNIKYLACRNYEAVTRNDGALSEMAVQKVDIKFKRIQSILNSNGSSILFIVKQQVIPSAPEFAASFSFGVYDRFRVQNESVYVDSWTLKSRWGLMHAIKEISRILEIEICQDIIEDLGFIDCEYSLCRIQQKAIANLFGYYDDLISAFNSREMRFSMAFNKMPESLEINDEDKMKLTTEFNSAFESTEVYSGIRDLINKAKQKFEEWKEKFVREKESQPEQK